MSAFSAISATGGGSDDVNACAVARGESLLSTEDSNAGGGSARVVSPANGVVAGLASSSVGAAVAGGADSAVVGINAGGGRENGPPSNHICPFIQEPPLNAVHFDVGNPTKQVYNRSSLYRYISIPGIRSAFWNVVHPFSRKMIPRHAALDSMHPAAPELLLQLHCEQALLGLPLEDENPLTNEDRARYGKTMVAMQARYAIPLLCYFLFIIISFIKTHFSLDEHTSMKSLPMTQRTWKASP
jgi:hypothetical protein